VWRGVDSDLCIIFLNAKRFRNCSDHNCLFFLKNSRLEIRSKMESVETISASPLRFFPILFQLTPTSNLGGKLTVKGKTEERGTQRFRDDERKRKSLLTKKTR
jgi:hypothetical protein